MLRMSGGTDAKTKLTADEIHNRQVCTSRRTGASCAVPGVLLTRDATVCPTPRVQWELNRKNFRAQWMCDMVWYTRSSDAVTTMTV